MGEAGSITMKQILIAGIIAALTIEAVESLNCVQCEWANSCANTNVATCNSSNARACTSSFMNLTLGIPNSLYSVKSCSEDLCDAKGPVVANFTVRVPDNKHVQFASHCCTTDGCNSKDAEPPSLNGIPGTLECPACHGSNASSCNKTTVQKCNVEERCVDLLAEYENGTTNEILVLKGCANINNSTCELLSAGNKTFGGVIFRQFKCSPNVSSTPAPPTNQTTTTPNASSKVSFTPLALASLLLLGLLL